MSRRRILRGMSIPTGGKDDLSEREYTPDGRRIIRNSKGKITHPKDLVVKEKIE